MCGKATRRRNDGESIPSASVLGTMKRQKHRGKGKKIVRLKRTVAEADVGLEVRVSDDRRQRRRVLRIVGQHAWQHWHAGDTITDMRRVKPDPRGSMEAKDRVV